MVAVIAFKIQSRLPLEKYRENKSTGQRGKKAKDL